MENNNLMCVVCGNSNTKELFYPENFNLNPIDKNWIYCRPCGLEKKPDPSKRCDSLNSVVTQRD